MPSEPDVPGGSFVRSVKGEASDGACPAFVVDTTTWVVFPCGASVVNRVPSDWRSVSGEVCRDPPGARSSLELPFPPGVRKQEVGFVTMGALEMCKTEMEVPN